MKIKKLLFYLFLSISYINAVESSLPVEVQAVSAIVMNADTGLILYEKDAYTASHPGSTTKIATALLAIKLSEGRLKEKVTAQQQAIGSLPYAERERRGKSSPSYVLEHGNSHIGIKRGEILDIETLLYGLMIASGNDAANVLAQHLSGDIPTFIHEMNIYMKSIGCKQTNFVNPHGLSRDDHLTTAYDLAMMAKEGLSIPLFKKIVSTVRYPRPATNMQKKTTMLQKNRLLRKSSDYYYSKCTGIKTGTVQKAGYCLVASAQQGDRNLIVVLLNCKSTAARFKEAKRVFEIAFAEPKLTREVLRKGKQNWVFDLKDAEKRLETYLEEPYTVEYYPSEEPIFKAHIERFPLILPIEQGTVVGEVRVFSEDGSIEKTVELKANNRVDLKLGAKLIRLWNGGGKTIAAILAALFAGFAILNWRRH